MAVKKVRGPGLSRFETIGGGVLLLLYLLLPVVLRPVFRGGAAGMDGAAAARVYYYVFFAVTLVVFYGFVGRSTGYFIGSLMSALAAAGLGLVLFYGFNELLFRLGRALFGRQINLNDYAVSAQTPDAPRTTLLILLLISPFIEEILFRGYVFGGLKGHSTVAAYVVSCLLFALSHVWQFLGGGFFSLGGLLLLFQYLAPGAVLAWAYDRSGCFWGPLLLHIAANALHLWWAL